jgi:hypothetical protein
MQSKHTWKYLLAYTILYRYPTFHGRQVFCQMHLAAVAVAVGVGARYSIAQALHQQWLCLRRRL